MTLLAPSGTNTQQLLTPRQLAEVCGLKPNTLAKMRVAGRGPAFTRCGRSIRYPLSLVEQWLQANIVAGADAAE
jgi:predicted DNA-binding transcriptional regulator AlpA